MKLTGKSGRKSVGRLMLLTLGFMISLQSYGDWRLIPEQSYVSFVSIKNNIVAEVHRFDSLTGSVSGEGRATVNIALTSVETNIPIRNERMNSMLFESETFALATAQSHLDLSQYTGLETGASSVTELALDLSLHGITGKVVAVVKVTRIAADTWQVNTVKPFIIDAASYNLSGGIDALRSVAGLSNIIPVVPVTFNLEFTES